MNDTTNTKRRTVLQGVSATAGALLLGCGDDGEGMASGSDSGGGSSGSSGGFGSGGANTTGGGTGSGGVDSSGGANTTSTGDDDDSTSTTGEPGDCDPADAWATGGTASMTATASRPLRPRSEVVRTAVRDHGGPVHGRHHRSAGRQRRARRTPGSTRASDRRRRRLRAHRGRVGRDLAHPAQRCVLRRDPERLVLLRRRPERGVRGDGARTRAPAGHGLGLSIAARVCELHGLELEIGPGEDGGVHARLEGPTIPPP